MTSTESAETAPPLVSVIIPMRNEQASIARCLDSVLANVLTSGDFEILVLYGESEDQSAQIVTEYSQRDPRVRLIPNPARLQAAAFNRGLDLARGGFVVRLDAHSIYADDYLAQCVRLLEETGAGNVGGVQRAVGTSWVSRAIAAAVSSKFAAGDARYRNATGACFTDTVYLGSWRTATLRRLGGMSTAWAVNEDDELNIRLRNAGETVYLSPTIRSTYFVRASFTKLARQYFRYGFWKVRTLRAYPGSLRWRQLVAPAFVASLALSWLLIHWLGSFGLAHVALYLGANVVASVISARRTSFAILPLLPIAFLIIHLSWGIGFWCGLTYWPLHRDDVPRGQ